MSPSADGRHGRRLPAEWEPQAGVQLTWPHTHGDWGEDIAAVEDSFLRLACAVLARQALVVSCYDRPQAERLRAQLAQRGADTHRLALVIAPSDDVWCRDHGPITVYVEGEPRLQDYRFNGWGGKYPHARDDRLTARLHAAGIYGAAPREPRDWILEGGSLDVDGAGTLLTTTACLLNPNRNPSLGRPGIEARLRAELGIERVLWLEHGELIGDDTDSHVDMLARFTDAGTIAYIHCPDTADPHHAPLAAMEAELRQLRQADGLPYRLVRLPWPRAHLDEGYRLPLSYANFLIINGAVLVPQYDDPADAEAVRVLQELFPEREALGVPALPIIRQYGSLHCVSMQLPAGLPLPRLGAWAVESQGLCGSEALARQGAARSEWP